MTQWVDLSSSIGSLDLATLPSIPCTQCQMIAEVVDQLNNLCVCYKYFTVEDVCCEGWEGDDCDVCSLDCGERRICDPFMVNATCVCDAARWSGENCETRSFFYISINYVQ